MSLPADCYTTGTATVANGSPDVVGVGTAWLAWLSAGDTFVGADGRGVRILAVTDDTHLVLVWDWPGTAQTAGNYRVDYARNPGRVLEKTREVIEAMKAPTWMSMIFDGSSTADANPGAGRVRFNDATTPTVAYISKTIIGGSDISGRLATFDDSLNTVSRAVLSFIPTDGANAFLDFDVIGAITDAATYVKVPVALRAGTVPTDKAALAMTGVPTGTEGADGAVVGTPAGAYDVSTTYSQTEYVTDQNSSWVYINATPGAGNAPPTLPTTTNAYWQLLTAQGAAGPAGLIGNFRGAWATATDYAVADAVSEGGSGYIVPAGKAHTSGVFADDLAAGKWTLVNAKGDTGAAGADGIFSAIASEADAEAGTDNTAGMTALRVAQAIAALAGGYAVTRKKVTVFTASGTWTPDPKMQFALIETYAGGGAGGGGQGAAGYSCHGSGGAPGGYSKKWVTPADVGASQTVTIGAPGVGVSGAAGGSGSTTAVGALCSANGGGGGDYSASNHVGSAATAATPGVGDLAAPGGLGGPSFYASITTVQHASGPGGSSPIGAGGPGTPSGSGLVNGLAATGYASGGGGGATFNTAGNVKGGNATGGYASVTEYLTD